MEINKTKIVLVVVLGFVCLCLCLVLVWSKFQFISGAEIAEGVVTEQTAGSGHVNVKFITREGKTITYAQNGFVSYDVGDKVRVLYRTENPRGTASTDAIGSLWFWAILFFIFTAGCFLMAFLMHKFPKYFG